jgi:hypothetical protein
VSLWPLRLLHLPQQDLLWARRRWRLLWSPLWVRKAAVMAL